MTYQANGGSDLHNDAAELKNDARTSPLRDTTGTHRRSGPVRFELVSYRGEIFGPFDSAAGAAYFAKAKWPDQEQDEDRTGKGWDVQVAGLKT